MYAFGGVTIVNAVPSWFGGAIAINLRVFAKIVPCDNICLYSSNLVETIVKYFISKYSLPRFNIEIVSEIPPKSGLKSSSAVAVASIKAIIEKFNLDERSIPRLAAELSIEAGASITGAFDDAASSYYGGAVLTDNLNMRIIRLFEPPHNLSAVVAIKGYRDRVIDIKKLRGYSYLFYDIFLKALEGNIFEAMKMNGLAIARLLGYDEAPIIDLIHRGALAAGISGNGPSIFAVCRKEDSHYFADVMIKYFNNIKIVDIVGVGGYEEYNKTL